MPCIIPVSTTVLLVLVGNPRSLQVNRERDRQALCILVSRIAREEQISMGDIHAMWHPYQREVSRPFW